jgi:hypothetical protein
MHIMSQAPLYVNNLVDSKRTVLGQIGNPMLKGGARVVPYLLYDWLDYITWPMLSPELEVGTRKCTVVDIVDRKRTVLGQIGNPMLKGCARVVPYML